MELKNSFLCIDCETLYSTEIDSSGDFGYLCERYKFQCPSCGSKQSMPIAEIIPPMSRARKSYRDSVFR